MKVILAGTTGFIGQEVLIQCLHHPAITSIVVLTRRVLPTQDPKLQVHIMEDFTAYPPSLLESLKTAEACIWTLGTTPSKATGENLDLAYALAAATAFTKSLIPHLPPSSPTFRFVYCSGIFVERDQQKNLWFLQEARRNRGLIETNLVAMTQAPGAFEAFIARPGLVLARGSWIPGFLMRWSRSVGVEEVAAVFVEEAVKGRVGGTIENEELRVRGRGLVRG